MVSKENLVINELGKALGIDNLKNVTEFTLRVTAEEIVILEITKITEEKELEKITKILMDKSKHGWGKCNQI